MQILPTNITNTRGKLRVAKTLSRLPEVDQIVTPMESEEVPI